MLNKKPLYSFIKAARGFKGAPCQMAALNELAVIAERAAADDIAPLPQTEPVGAWLAAEEKHFAGDAACAMPEKGGFKTSLISEAFDALYQALGRAYAIDTIPLKPALYRERLQRQQAMLRAAEAAKPAYIRERSGAA